MKCSTVHSSYILCDRELRPRNRWVTLGDLTLLAYACTAATSSTTVIARCLPRNRLITGEVLRFTASPHPSPRRQVNECQGWHSPPCSTHRRTPRPRRTHLCGRPPPPFPCRNQVFFVTMHHSKPLYCKILKLIGSSGNHPIGQSNIAVSSIILHVF